MKNVQIICEHFKLTDAIQNCVTSELESLDLVIGDVEKPTIFLKRICSHQFEVVIKSRVWGRDIVIKSQGADLYCLIHEAVNLLKKRVRIRKGRLRTNNNRRGLQMQSGA